MLKKIIAILCLLIGIAVIILGASFDSEVYTHYVGINKTYQYSAPYHRLDSAKFGADFYTYIYDGSVKIVDTLDDINDSIETVVDAENDIFQATAATFYATRALSESVIKAFRTLIIAIGLMILAFGLKEIGSAFTKAPQPSFAAQASPVTPDEPAKPDPDGEPQI